MPLVYKENKKHKPWASGDGPPRWFPDKDTPCPDPADLPTKDAQNLLDNSVEGADDAHPNKKARYAMDGDGRVYKGYTESTVAGQELWHGYPVNESKIPRQVPARVLRQFMGQGLLTSARYKRLIGNAK